MPGSRRRDARAARHDWQARGLDRLDRDGSTAGPWVRSYGAAVEALAEPGEVDGDDESTGRGRFR
jgi:hypothetical protein